MERISPTSRIISAIDRYSKYLTDFSNQQINIAERTTKLLEKKRLEEFGAEIQNQLKGITSLPDLINKTSSLISQAVGSGMMEAIPLINQFTELRIKEISAGIEEETTQALYNNLDRNAYVIVGNQLKKVGEILEDPEIKKLPPNIQYKYVTNLTKPEVNLGGNYINGKEQLVRSTIHPQTKEVLSTDVYDIYSKNNKKFYKENGIEKYVPDDIIDEIQREKYFEIQKESMLFNLKEAQEKLKTFNVSEASKLGEIAYHMKKTLAEQIVYDRLQQIINENPDKYNREDDNYEQKVADLHKQLTQVYNPYNIIDIIKKEGINKFNLTEKDLNMINTIEENDAFSQEALIISQKYKNDRNFQDAYYNTKDILESLINDDMISFYSNQNGIDSEQLKSIVISYEEAKANKNYNVVVDLIKELHRLLKNKKGKSE